VRRTAVAFLARPAVAALLVLAPACTGDDRIPLRYGLQEGTVLRYELVLRAEVERTLEEQRQIQDVEASFDVTQAILETTPEGGSTARLSLQPVSLVVDGVPSEAGPGQEFVVELGPDGRVVDIGEPDVEGTEELAPLGIERLLPRLRPVLPGTEVAAGDSWSSQTEFSDPAGTFELSTDSHLEQLGVLAGRPAALVRTTYESPVNRRERFANALAELVGTDIGAQESWFALDGFLIRSVSDSVGTYTVTFRPPEGELGVTPVEGALVVSLHTEMRLVGPPPTGG
jgi:hypothetical protein